MCANTAKRKADSRNSLTKMFKSECYQVSGLIRRKYRGEVLKDITRLE